MSDAAENLNRFKKRHKKLLLGIAVFFALYTLFGFLLLPFIVKSMLTSRLTENLGRTTEIESVRINPYALTLRINGFKVKTISAADTFISFDELFVNLQASSVFKRGLVVKELRLVKPVIDFSRNKDMTYNFSDLIPTSPGKAEKPHTQNDKDTGFAFSINNIQLLDGKVVFSDLAKDVTHKAKEINITLPFISNMPSEIESFVTPLFSTIFNDTRLDFKGTTKPFSNSLETTFDINLTDLEVPYYAAYSPVELDYKVMDGRLSANTTLSYIQYADKTPTLELKGGVRLKNLDLRDNSGGEMAGFELLVVKIASAKIFAKDIHISSILLQKPELNAVRNKKGIFNLALLAPEMEASENIEAKTTGDEEAAGSEVGLNIDQIKLTGGSVTFSDFTTPSPFKKTIEPFFVTISDFSLAPDKKALLDMGFSNDNREHINIYGDFSINPVTANLSLDINGIMLSPVQPYLEGTMKAAVTRGRFSTSGKLTASLTQPDGFKLNYKGVAGVRRLKLRDRVNKKSLASIGSLRLSGINVDINPMSIAVKRVRLGDFTIALGVNPNGELNINQILGKQKTPATITSKARTRARAGAGAGSGGGPEPQSAAAQMSATPVGTVVGTESHATAETVEASLKAATAQAPSEIISTGPKATESGELPISLPEITFKNGHLRFTDNSLAPVYSVDVVEIKGALTGLSSINNKPATLKLSTRLDKHANVLISGQINPFSKKLFVDLKFTLDDFELSSVTPYSGKYIGYTIEKGKLMLDLDYAIDKKELRAENKIIIEQITLGSKIESEHATGLPVRFALGLLKDRRGVIDIDMPLSGRTDDPEFSVAGLVIKVFINLVTKAVTSPFALLGALTGGGGEELSYVEFTAGNYELTEDNTKKLDNLVTALYDRPGLNVDIEGYVDTDADRVAVRVKRFNNKIKHQKLKKLSRKERETAVLSDITIEPDEYEKYLWRAYKAEKFEKPRNRLRMTKKIEPEEMKALMLSHIIITDDDLRGLASNRSNAVKQYILNTQKIKPARVFTVWPESLTPEEKENLSKSRVDFKLK